MYAESTVQKCALSFLFSKRPYQLDHYGLSFLLFVNARCRQGKKCKHSPCRSKTVDPLDFSVISTNIIRPNTSRCACIIAYLWKITLTPILSILSIWVFWLIFGLHVNLKWQRTLLGFSKIHCMSTKDMVIISQVKCTSIHLQCQFKYQLFSDNWA